MRDDDLFVNRIRTYATLADGKQVRILEAGCGTGELPPVEGVDCHITGIDDDHPTLRARTVRRGDLDLWMLGDLRTLGLPHRSFDIIHSSHLLHRARNAELVLDRMLTALRPGGLLLLRFTDRETAYGFCVRLLPIWAKRLLRRWLRLRGGRKGERSTTKISETPVPTYFEPLASHRGMQRYCLLRGLLVMDEYGEPRRFDQHGRLGRAIDAAVRAVAAISRGRLSADHADLVFVIHKPEDRLARVLHPYSAR